MSDKQEARGSGINRAERVMGRRGLTGCRRASVRDSKAEGLADIDLRVDERGDDLHLYNLAHYLFLINSSNLFLSSNGPFS